MIGAVVGMAMGMVKLLLHGTLLDVVGEFSGRHATEMGGTKS